MVKNSLFSSLFHFILLISKVVAMCMCMGEFFESQGLNYDKVLNSGVLKREISLSPASRLAVFDVTTPCDGPGIPVHLQAHIFSLHLPKKDVVAYERRLVASLGQSRNSLSTQFRHTADVSTL